MSRLDCPLLARCPGCPLGSEDYDAGLSRKASELTRTLAPYTDLSPELLAARAATPAHQYRLRAKLVVERKALGLFERGSHRVVDVSGCRVLSPELTHATELVRSALPLPIYGADLRATSEGVWLTLLTDDPASRPRLESAARELHARGISSVALSVRQAGSVRLLAGEPEVVAGPKAARHRLREDLPYAYAAHGGFVQAHAGQASYVQTAIGDHLRARWGSLIGRRVLELFAGNGSLALALAREGARVTAVESYGPAIQLAQRAAREQALELDAVTGDAARFATGASGRAGFDAVVVNPPRRGLSSALRTALARSNAATLVYVSCNPLTLARDAWHLGSLGLGLKSVEPLDMIPWSDAVEALCFFEPTEPPAPHTLFENAAWLAVEKRPWEAVVAAPGEASLLERVRRSLAPDAVPVDAWGSGVSGVCWFAKHGSGVKTLRVALDGVERELVVLVRGNLRKQGTVSRRAAMGATRGARYKKQTDAGRHSLASAFVLDATEQGALRDFAHIGHPVLGDAAHGDQRSNEHAEHRHGLDRPFVHCRSLELREPSGAIVRVTCELGPDLTQVLSSVQLD